MVYSPDIQKLIVQNEIKKFTWKNTWILYYILPPTIQHSIYLCSSLVRSPLHINPVQFVSFTKEKRREHQHRKKYRRSQERSSQFNWKCKTGFEIIYFLMLQKITYCKVVVHFITILTLAIFYCIRAPTLLMVMAYDWKGDWHGLRTNDLTR